MARQTAQDRARRLEQGRCPIHGIDMPQVGLNTCGPGFVVECPRKDCNIQGKSLEPSGPVDLLAEFEGVIAAGDA